MLPNAREMCNPPRTLGPAVLGFLSGSPVISAYGATVIGPEARSSSTRIVVVRLPAADERLRAADAYLPPAGSVTEDLMVPACRISDPTAVERSLAGFLSWQDGGLERIPDAAYRTLVDLFDRNWLAAPANVLIASETAAPDIGATTPALRRCSRPPHTTTKSALVRAARLLTTANCTAAAPPTPSAS